jgi:CDP-glucose 4,6-dehydratase
LKFSQAFNFGPSANDHLSVESIVKKTLELWNDSKITYKDISDNSGPYESHYLSLDISRAKNILHWKPTLPIETALKFTVDWYKYYLIDPQKSKEIISSQIIKFFEYSS